MAAETYDYVSLHMPHQGGTKYYRLISIQGSSGRGLLITNWGKVGAIGEIKVERAISKNELNRVSEKKFKEKAGRGYRSEATKSAEGLALPDVAKRLTPALWAKISNADLQFLDPSLDTSTRPEAKPPRFDEDGNFLGDPEPLKVDVKEELAAQKEAELDTMRAHPLFGKF